MTTITQGAITAPQTYEEYCAWLSQQDGFSEDEDRNAYALVARALKSQATDCPIWAQFVGSMDEYAAQYQIKTSLELFYLDSQSTPEFVTKPYESYLQKTFRYSCKRKTLPKDWSTDQKAKPLPCDYLGTIDDIARTTVVVKFLDGVEFVVRKLNEICRHNNAIPRIEWKCSDEGYFAAHFYIPVMVNCHVTNQRMLSKEIPVEIQITTQLQEVLRRFLHFQYEIDRMATRVPSTIPWQWRYRENEFFTNYLGHVLRNVEGQIMDARRKRNIPDACT